VRVVPNLYPAFLDPPREPSVSPPFRALDARGRHEVVVHSPRHVVSLAQLEDEALARVATAWRARAASAREAGYAYVHAFVNEGRAAGASRAHSHSQLVWLPERPPALSPAARPDGCALCGVLAAEIAAGARVVMARDGVLCLCSYAGRVPYELLVAPTACETDGLASELLAPALSVVAEAIRRLHVVAGEAALNVWLVTTPFTDDVTHWHLVVLPRLTVLAGLELGAELYVNTLAPEQGAEALRAAL
jgi:UDPglucose--hexose-1-phosphate uridylyltransferase